MDTVKCPLCYVEFKRDATGLQIGFQWWTRCPQKRGDTDPDCGGLDLLLKSHVADRKKGR